MIIQILYNVIVLQRFHKIICIFHWIKIELKKKNLKNLKKHAIIYFILM